MKIRLIMTVAALMAAVVLGGCQMTGSAIQGVGGVVNKTGSTIGNLGR